ncbi:hypothetical protein R6Q59_007251 [Mikania micrantha]
MGSCFSAESRNPLPPSPTSSPGIGKRKNYKKRPPGLRNSSFDHRKEDQLRRIAGRMFLNGSSEVASLFTQQGKKGTNQDAMIVWENFGSRTDTVFCGVFDGHGPVGHMVGKRVRDSLPLKLSEHWKVNLKNTDDVLREIGRSLNTEGTSSEASVNFEETDKNPEIFQTLKESFLKAFKVMDRELSMYANSDCFCSGTTAVTLIKQGQHLIIGNIGDSRAVLCTRDKDNSLIPVQLTVDLKPNLPGGLGNKRTWVNPRPIWPFSNKVLEGRHISICEDTNQLWDEMAEKVTRAAKETLGMTTGYKKGQKESWWWNEEVQLKVREKQQRFRVLPVVRKPQRGPD